MIKGTVHRVSNATSNWLAFHQALEENKTCWTKNLAARKLKKLCKLHVVFITQNLRSCLPTLKSFFDRDLKSHVIYEIKCNGCGYIYVGQTSRRVTTRKPEHQKKDSRVGRHLVQDCGATNDIEWKVLDAYRTVEKLMTNNSMYAQCTLQCTLFVFELILQWYTQSDGIAKGASLAVIGVKNLESKTSLYTL